MPYLLALAFVFLFECCASFPSQRVAPIIGIVVEPFAYSNPPVCVSVYSPRPVTAPALSTNASSGCVYSVYVKWLENSGIRVLPIQWNSNQSRLDYLLDRVNGVLFPGGIIQGDQHVTEEYFKVVQYIVHRAVNTYNLEMNDRFAVWGTCQGFEMLHAAFAGTLSVISDGFVGMEPRMLNVTFTDVPKGADRLYALFPDTLRRAAQTTPLTLNWHSKGILPTAYTKYAATLGKYLLPLTTSVDTAGRTFISSAQGRNESIRVFATQFHPERPPFEFDNDAIGHSADALEVSMKLGLQLRIHLSESNHSFEDPSEANRLLIENYRPVNLGWGMEVYFL